eukprot:augustus_masked-scaffold_4-processed-gene-12.44-mRNA-1 protein AED:1.00 eAED:1.00 QI:0/-1/0/0/-1/1/1/0/408
MFEKEERVLVCGLKSAAQYNDCFATIISTATEDSPRYLIKLDEGKELRVRESNLSKLDKSCVEKFSVGDLKGLITKEKPEADLSSFLTKKELQNFVQENITEEKIISFTKPKPESLEQRTSSSTPSPVSEDLFNNPKFKEAAEKMKNMPADELRTQMLRQKEMLENNPHIFAQMQTQNPHMRNMTREQVIRHLDSMSKIDPTNLQRMASLEQQLKPLAQQTGGNPGMFPKGVQAKDMKEMIRLQREMIESNPAMLSEMRKTNPQMANFSDEQIMKQLNMMDSLSEEQINAVKKMQEMQNKDNKVDMSGKDMKEAMKLQKEMMENNPDMFEQMLESNPALKKMGMTKEQFQKQMDRMSKMSPEDFERGMAVQRKIQQVQGFCSQYGRLFVLGIVGIVICYVIDRFFISI